MAIAAGSPGNCEGSVIEEESRSCSHIAWRAIRNKPRWDRRPAAIDEILVGINACHWELLTIILPQTLGQERW